MTHNRRERRYLVTGATGSQGGAVARLLAGRGDDVRGVARQPGRSGAPETSLITTAAADLGNADDLRKAFDGVTHAAVVMPLEYNHETVTRYATNIAQAAREAGVERLVYNTNTPLPDTITGFAGFETRRAAEEILLDSGVTTVVIRPPVYLDNLFSPWNGPALVNDGVLAYPLPADQRVAWMSHQDLAVVVAAALEAEHLGGRVLNVGGAEILTGPELADRFSRGLEREVSYLPLEVDRFEAGLGEVVGATAAAGVAGIYHHVATGTAAHLLAPEPADVERELGVRLTPALEWITGQPWQTWAGTAN
ncbi:SDR family oxidoreductase [Streptomyces marincola]|uniref:NmrA family transcriptional regulator n=1 Tax=Streptomyces marincola TaxID=2878388 RepID=A0A1W7D214_9ACTN|nr:NmrA family NAD(P)-binding protein [Streptomyces marincola]ARQ70969.1 NmrA family transcriptional regulator [Streptomyces marincola]